MTNYTFKHACGGIACHSSEWLISVLGWDPFGKGDIIFRTAMYAIITGDKELLKFCVQLLKEGKRWPNSMNQDCDSPNIFIEYLDKVISKFNMRASRTKWVPIIPWRIRYRCQNRMTRDPIIMVLIAWELLDGEGECPIKVPWYLQRPDMYHWGRWIKTGRSKHKRRYEWWATLGSGKNMPMYALHLECWRAWKIDSDKVKKYLQPLIPDWNHACRLLIDHPLNHLSYGFMKNYKARSLYQWTWPVYITPPADSTFYLDEEDELKWDKDVLNFLLNFTHNN